MKSIDAIKNNECFSLKGNKYQISPQPEFQGHKYYYVFTHVKGGHYSNPFTFRVDISHTPEQILAQLMREIEDGYFDQNL